MVSLYVYVTIALFSIGQLRFYNILLYEIALSVVIGAAIG